MGILKLKRVRGASLNSRKYTENVRWHILNFYANGRCTFLDFEKWRNNKLRAHTSPLLCTVLCAQNVQRTVQCMDIYISVNSRNAGKSVEVTFSFIIIYSVCTRLLFGPTGVPSLLENSPLLGPYRRPTPRVLGGSYEGGRFLMSKIPLHIFFHTQPFVEFLFFTTPRHAPRRCCSHRSPRTVLWVLGGCASF